MEDFYIAIFGVIVFLIGGIIFAAYMEWTKYHEAGCVLSMKQKNFTEYYMDDGWICPVK